MILNFVNFFQLYDILVIWMKCDVTVRCQLVDCCVLVLKKQSTQRFGCRMLGGRMLVVTTITRALGIEAAVENARDKPHKQGGAC